MGYRESLEGSGLESRSVCVRGVRVGGLGVSCFCTR